MKAQDSEKNGQDRLSGYQAKYLRGLAHRLKPVVFVGQKGLTRELIASVNSALDRHELIKVKFVEYKEKGEKQPIVQAIERQVPCHLAGMIGHMAIFYRPHRNQEKRRITLPSR
jgi:RNA-binding protein